MQIIIWNMIFRGEASPRALADALSPEDKKMKGKGNYQEAE